MRIVSNPYSREILSAVAQRIGHDRLVIAGEWCHEHLQQYGAGGIGADALSVIGSPAERAWLTEHGTLLDAIRRLHDESAESVYAIQRPARWLIRVLFWALGEPSLSSEWLDDSLIQYEPSEAEVLAKALFTEDSASSEILRNHLNSRDPVRDPVRDRMSLLGGALWSLSALTVLTPVLLAHLDHSENLALQPIPTALAVSLFADLRADILGDDRLDQFRAIARRRQERARDGQGTEE